MPLLQGGVFFRGNANGFGEDFDEVAVIVKAAGCTGSGNGHAPGKQILGKGDPLGGDILVQCRTGGVAKQLAKVYCYLEC